MRRFLSVFAWAAASGLLACTTPAPTAPYAAPTSRADLEAPLQAAIVGPTFITTKATYEWKAVANGGSGGFTYRWGGQRLVEDSIADRLTSDRNALRMVLAPGDGTVELTLTVSSGSHTAVRHALVVTADAAAPPLAAARR